MVLLSRRAIVAASLLVSPFAVVAQTDGDASTVEIVAAQWLVSKYKPGAVNLDPTLFTKVGESVRASTRTRPMLRQEALAAALRTEIYHSDSLPVTVRATEPVIIGNEARIVVCVSKPVPPRAKEEWESRAPPRITMSETIEVVLDRRGDEWVTRQRLHPQRERSIPMASNRRWC